MNSQPSVQPNVSTRTRALICQSGKLNLESIQLPHLGPQEIAVKVMAIGLCRTDLYAISGEIETYSDRFIPGHEFAGIVFGVGSAVIDLNPGDRVAINPILSCRHCPDCRAGSSHLCSNTNLMGVDLDGGCRGEIVIPQSRAYRIPNSLKFTAAAFAEPVAASLAILKSEILPHQTGVIIGSNRIAELARRVLEAHKFNSVSVVSLKQARDLDSSQFDFVIETEASTEVFEQMVRLVRPRGKLILKSRQHQPFELRLRSMIEKEPKIEVVNYGRFDEAVRTLADGEVVVDDLIGEQYDFEQFESAIATALADEAKKTFLVLGN